ncbi:hypothetical protein [Tuwongella immobilis]|uniref:Uncharacterized protein n=1 Tax=Tuwongella immobilis TaxID=692036 RepID=A0A6C2YIJ2_9BACT|nr:hypothetical protein [Tuwongella immobilis]VIP01091.1 unnamed protein product [Tuwongella immobilis]VTR97607.1 unnamed protein product [Tuwongella immobilis]
MPRGLQILIGGICLALVWVFYLLMNLPPELDRKPGDKPQQTLAQVVCMITFGVWAFALLIPYGRPMSYRIASFILAAMLGALSIYAFQKSDYRASSFAGIVGGTCLTYALLGRFEHEPPVRIRPRKPRSRSEDYDDNDDDDETPRPKPIRKKRKPSTD